LHYFIWSHLCSADIFAGIHAVEDDGTAKRVLRFFPYSETEARTIDSGYLYFFFIWWEITRFFWYLLTPRRTPGKLLVELYHTTEEGVRVLRLSCPRAAEITNMIGIEIKFIYFIFFR
jgi:hypothetical protein